MISVFSSALKKFDDKFIQVTGYKPSRRITSLPEVCGRVTVASLAGGFAYQGAKDIANEGA
jgi:hypothetical protein